MAPAPDDGPNRLNAGFAGSLAGAVVAAGIGTGAGKPNGDLAAADEGPKSGLFASPPEAVVAAAGVPPGADGSGNEVFAASSAAGVDPGSGPKEKPLAGLGASPPGGLGASLSLSLPAIGKLNDGTVGGAAVGSVKLGVVAAGLGAVPANNGFGGRLKPELSPPVAGGFAASAPVLGVEPGRGPNENAGFGAASPEAGLGAAVDVGKESLGGSVVAAAGLSAPAGFDVPASGALANSGFDDGAVPVLDGAAVGRGVDAKLGPGGGAFFFFSASSFSFSLRLSAESASASASCFSHFEKLLEYRSWSGRSTVEPPVAMRFPRVPKPAPPAPLVRANGLARASDAGLRPGVEPGVVRAERLGVSQSSTFPPVPPRELDGDGSVVMRAICFAALSSGASGSEPSSSVS